MLDALGQFPRLNLVASHADQQVLMGVTHEVIRVVVVERVSGSEDPEGRVEDLQDPLDCLLHRGVLAGARQFHDCLGVRVWILRSHRAGVPLVGEPVVR